ncbi:D-glycero-beta-D-manno-heptose 1-phosphate adenylyltransferase [Paenarthrobacter sp. PH39-S1]|uniref:D-glycero-beta-D-manno-heptose 1-phosphate adenylyltransferase n=1 Tax=Paenarthrobacter sp. PH39-S1 TaxID=3046204 RepID=UPI0024BBCC2A|nr:D-glycero-beta-D-manno-heptose 1-phosphate adenylyltransferase [Paenarthrobacter sp. PH39-S1]MDJ0355348.1 D-glycero-beta-D-manno-heptose 1-phosphate adenylyltransferase [Paenarthrobacter sp. PH39-S1]
MSPMMDQRGLTEWLPRRLAELSPRVTVIGDVILDGWWSGVIERLCREAPAPVVEIQHREYAPGGAANTAMNLAALGAQVRLVGLVGDDNAGATLRQLLQHAGVDVSGLVAHTGQSTTTKCRVLSAGQVMLRMDEPAGNPDPDALRLLAQRLPGCLATADAAVICDYGLGALTGAVATALLTELARGDDPADPADRADPVGRARPLVLVDAHDPRPWAALEPDLVTPNAAEAARVIDRPLPAGAARADLFVDHQRQLLTATRSGAAIVTLDRDGTVLLSRDGTVHRTWARPATEKQASGAGDTFVAALTIARAAELPLSTCADLAQAAADVVVLRQGTSVCSTVDLSRHLAGFADTALDADELLAKIASERADGRRIVLTNGCFDVLHRGHTRYLNQAKQLGDILVVALNSDDSVRRLKGPDRPINTVGDRAAVIAALSCVDYVTVFDSATPIPLITALRPDVYAKGGDYTPDMLEETGAVEVYGGQVRILDYVPEHSTTAVVRRIRG